MRLPVNMFPEWPADENPWDTNPSTNPLPLATKSNTNENNAIRRKALFAFFVHADDFRCLIDVIPENFIVASRTEFLTVCHCETLRLGPVDTQIDDCQK